MARAVVGVGVRTVGGLVAIDTLAAVARIQRRVGALTVVDALHALVLSIANRERERTVVVVVAARLTLVVDAMRSAARAMTVHQALLALTVFHIAEQIARAVVLRIAFAALLGHDRADRILGIAHRRLEAAYARTCIGIADRG